ncbi:MAG TPA: hypothetical protein VM677_10480 [Actinokineospora sp.]|jgi:hypothetical protein|nr:hypothetical protein [Actinokineospora sp.]
MKSAEPQYYALLSFDVANSGPRNTIGSVRLRGVLRAALTEACAEAGFDLADCAPDDRGDGTILHVPSRVPKPRLINPLLSHLADSLRQHNRGASDDDQVRVRAAFHAGDLVADADGLTGSPKVLLGRLVDSAALRQALSAAPRSATVALIVSKPIWEDVVTQGARGVDADLFTQVTVREKETEALAWITMVGHGAPIVARESAAPKPSPPPMAHNSFGSINFHDNAVVRGDVVQQKNVYEQ